MSEGRRYQILGVIGKGGFGTVYKAELLGEGGFKRTVALKVLNADMREMEDVASRLRDEARLLGLLRHRAILGVDGLVRLNGRWTVVMEFINGADLGRVTKTSRFPLGPALEVVGEVASALHVAYTTPSPQGVPLRLLHRDLKPQNILLTAAGETKVLDFGIARAEFSNREAKTQSVLYGSVAYMAPERLDFEELHEGDVYALGVVLYELLTGEQFGKASIRGERHAKAVEDAIHRVRRATPDAGPGFLELLSAMLSYDPEERPNAREVERRCRALRSELNDAPWLRDWAESVVPEVLKGMAELGQDDFSGSILVESQTVSKLDEAPNKTYFVESTPVEQPPRKSSLIPRLALGGSLAGCLILALGLGAVMAIIVVSLLMMPSEVFVDLDTGAIPENPNEAWETDAIVEVDTKDAEALDGAYGPPKGFSYKVAITNPWKRMKLPVGKGNITASQPASLVVMYGAGPLKPMVKRWEERLTAIGYETTMMYDGDQACTRILKKGGKQMALSVVPSNENLIVSLSEM